MAASSKQVLLLAVIAAAVACLASPASATQWVVGDQCGWSSDFNQTCWAAGKTFVVGDTLQFVYPKDMHTVVQVGEDDFSACNLKGNQLGSWCSGNDVVQLDKPGKMFFICTKPNQCLNGMKLAIDVVNLTVAPSPPPSQVYLPLVSDPALAALATLAAAPPAPAPAPTSQAAAPPAPAPAPPPASQAAAPPASAPAPAWPAAAPPAPAPAPASPATAPGALPAPAPAPAPSPAAVSNPVGGVVAAAAAAVVAAALAF